MALMKFILRIIAFIFLLFVGLMSIGAAIRSLRGLISGQADMGQLYGLLYFFLAFSIAVWVWGLIHKVIKKQWPSVFLEKARRGWKLYAAVTFVFAVLLGLSVTPLSGYSMIGYGFGFDFGQLASVEFSSLLGVEMPDILASLTALIFEWFYASFIVGFCVWIYSAIRGAKLKESEQEDLESGEFAD